jgi:hypothetical protein
MKNSEQITYAATGIICLIALFMAFLSQVKQTNKYYKLACIQSDIIRNYHDSSNTDIYNVAQDYLGIIGMDTNTLEEYSYCY